MEQFKGTKGPWQLTTVPFEIAVSDSIASIYGPMIGGGSPLITGHISRSVGNIQALANAHLIAAAPDLLEALQNLVQLKEWKERNGKDEHYEKAQPIALHAARSAISKALNQEV